MRTLAEDIGTALGCGAHVTALRRTEVGPYTVDAAVTLPTLEAQALEGVQTLDEFLRPVESALSEWPKVRLSDDAAYYLRLGQAVVVPPRADYRLGTPIRWRCPIRRCRPGTGRRQGRAEALSQHPVSA